MSIRRTPLIAYEKGALNAREDSLAVEEPLEIAVIYHEDGLPQRTTIAVTMRTPGHDEELALGFVLTEGIVASARDVSGISKRAAVPVEARDNVVQVELIESVAFDPSRFSRHVYTTSSCGVCGKTSIDALRSVALEPSASEMKLTAASIVGWPDALAQSQAVFRRTGGLHAVAAFDTGGELLDLREDVGRHNAMDKLIGSLAQAGALPAKDRAFLVSGRASFELVQKALVAGVPVLAAVGAPSSLAVDLAREYGLTLIGFLRDGRFNVYSGESRIEVS